MELTRQGLRVLMIEAGPEICRKDFEHLESKPTPSGTINLGARIRATLRGQHVQARVSLFNDRIAPFYVNDWRNPYTTPRDAPYLWFRGRQGGGRLRTFGRVMMRWSDDDFCMFSRTGKGVDWPISYQDLAPYYAEVERFLGIHGQRDDVETVPDAVCAYRSHLTEAEEHFKRSVEQRDPARRVVSRRYMMPERDRVPKPMATALATGRLTVQYNMVARSVLTDPATGRAIGVTCTDAVTGKERVYHAAALVICASAIESVRLLLNSGKPGKGGLGNSSGQLGRYFMDQLPCLAVGTMPPFQGCEDDPTAPSESDPFYHFPGGIFIPRRLPRNGDSQPRNYAFQGKIARTPVPADAHSKFTFMGYGEMMPSRDNWIKLDPKKRDEWSLPAPRIRCAISPQDENTLQTLQSALTDMISDADGELDFIGSPLGLIEMGRGAFPEEGFIIRQTFRRLFPRTMRMGTAIHESGGARMGEDPRSSVLDPWCRLRDVPNILVTDAAAFPTSGVTGPTLTIMAVTLRACRKLARDMCVGSLPGNSALSSQI
jgi:choline dehydrogenase-like flavoprotein